MWLTICYVLTTQLFCFRFASDWTATVLIQRNPATSLVFQRSQVVCPALLCSALRIVSLQSQRETLWRASGRTNRKPSERTGGMIYNQQRELQLTGMRVDWRATGSIVETVRFILHASWKYNEQEPTTQKPTYRHPRMQAHNYECLQALAATQIKWEHTHTHSAY